MVLTHSLTCLSMWLQFDGPYTQPHMSEYVAPIWWSLHTASHVWVCGSNLMVLTHTNTYCSAYISAKFISPSSQSDMWSLSIQRGGTSILEGGTSTHWPVLLSHFNPIGSFFFIMFDPTDLLFSAWEISLSLSCLVPEIICLKIGNRLHQNQPKCKIW